MPLTIAIHLSKNQRFAEAQRWFHFLLDPTDDSEGTTPERFWKINPFGPISGRPKILVISFHRADGDFASDCRRYRRLEGRAFPSAVVARYPQPDYMYQTVMAYLDNLIAWGDCFPAGYRRSH